MSWSFGEAWAAMLGPLIQPPKSGCGQSHFLVPRISPSSSDVLGGRRRPTGIGVYSGIQWSWTGAWPARGLGWPSAMKLCLV